MIQTRASLGVSALLLMLACSPSTPATETATSTATSAAPDTAADNAAVAKAHDVLEGSYRTSDCNAMVSEAANDAVFEPPNTPSAKGVDGIRAWCQPLFSQIDQVAYGVEQADHPIGGPGRRPRRLRLGAHAG